ncbi:Purine efflux pump PbuE [Nymphon striatum]|nr:Purine efflux pump PbuE [Nymphon striatum]
MGAFMVIGLLGPVSEGLNMTPASAGWMMTIYALAYAVLSPLLVSGTGRIGRRRVLAIGLGLFALANLVAALSTSVSMLLFARIIAAAGAGMFTPIAAAVAAGLSAPEARGRALAAVFFGLTLAQVLGVPAGSWLAYTFGWRVAFFVVVALAVPCIWLIWTFIPSGLSFQAVSLRDLGRTLRNGPIMLAVMITASFLSGIYVVYTYMSPLLSGTMGFGRDGITAALLVFGCGAVIGNLVGGRVSDRIGPIRTLTILASLQGDMPAGVFISAAAARRGVCVFWHLVQFRVVVHGRSANPPDWHGTGNGQRGSGVECGGNLCRGSAGIGLGRDRSGPVRPDGAGLDRRCGCVA